MASYPVVPPVSFNITVEILPPNVYLPVVLPNLKSEGLSLNQTIYTGHQDWSYTLPPAVYASPNKTDDRIYQVDVDVSTPTFIKWNDNDHSFSVPGPITDEMIGNHTIQIVLAVIDFNSTQRSQTYELSLCILRLPSSSPVVIGTPKKFETQQDTIKATLYEIKSSGLVMLNFTEKLVISSNFWDTYAKH